MNDYRVEREAVEIFRYTMPAKTTPDGRTRVNWTDVDKMWHHAAIAYRKAKGLPDGASIPDNAIWYEAHDEAVVIAFELSRRETQS